METSESLTEGEETEGSKSGGYADGALRGEGLGIWRERHGENITGIDRDADIVLWN